MCREGQIFRDGICKCENLIVIPTPFQCHFFMEQQGPTMPILCEGTPENPTINLATTWPECKQLSCVPMGQSGLNLTQSVNVLETSCPSNDTYTMFTDAQNQEGYIIPKRFHCGTYKPNDPTYASKCPIEAYGKRMLKNKNRK